jgi:hypothetical protein
MLGVPGGVSAPEMLLTSSLPLATGIIGQYTKNISSSGGIWCGKYLSSSEGEGADGDFSPSNQTEISMNA